MEDLAIKMTGIISNVSGIIIGFLSAEQALISFFNNGILQTAMVKKDCFYFDGRKIGSKSLEDYLQVGVTVRFSCQSSHDNNTNYDYIAIICWRETRIFMASTTFRKSLDYQFGKITKLTRRRGVISIMENGKIHEVLFLASNVYINGKRLGVKKSLDEELFESQHVIVDAIPSISDQNDDKCGWFATCVYLGKKPKFIYENSPYYNKSNVHSSNNFKGMKWYFRMFAEIIHTPDTLYISGKGIILSVLNEEFGIIMAEIRKNVFQTMLFHRKNFFLMKSSLSKYDIRTILHEGDKTKFIAVGAPEGFPTSWIAVQATIDE